MFLNIFHANTSLPSSYDLGRASLIQPMGKAEWLQPLPLFAAFPTCLQ